jgi:hypothetical protein
MYNWDEKGFLIGIARTMKRIITKQAYDSGKITGAKQPAGLADRVMRRQISDRQIRGRQGLRLPICGMLLRATFSYKLFSPTNFLL